MSYLIALAMVLPMTLLVVDAARRTGAFVRPAFYLLSTIYIYATFGYLSHLYFPPEEFPFMLPFRETTIQLGYFYSALAMLGIYLGGKLYLSADTQAGHQSSKMLFKLALAGCVFAIAANLYSFISSGFIVGDFDRVTFIDEVKAGGGFNIPYMSILLASLPVLVLNERRALFWVSWAVFGSFALIHLPVGDRRVVLSALIVLVVAKLLKGSVISRKTLLMILIASVLVGIFVGSMRAGSFYSALTPDPRRVFLSLSEFARPFVTLLYYIDSNQTLLLGRSFLEGFVNIVPQTLLPFDKFQSPGQHFRDVIDRLDVFPGRVPGYGFFPVTEALINFTPFGIPIFFFIFSTLIRKFSQYATSIGLTFVIPALCSAMFSFGRSSFTDILVTYTWVIAFGISIYVLSKLIKEVRERVRSVGDRPHAKRTE